MTYSIQVQAFQTSYKISIARLNPNIYAAGSDLRIQTTLAIFSACAQTLVTTSLILYRILSVTRETKPVLGRAHSARTYKAVIDPHHTIRRGILSRSTHMGNCMGIACVRGNAPLYRTNMLHLCRMSLCFSVFPQCGFVEC